MASKESPAFLLLLPQCPLPTSFPAMRVAFGDTVRRTFEEIYARVKRSSNGSVLDIAIACPSFAGARRTSSSNFFDQVQRLVAAVYRLVGTIAAKDGINIEDSEGVDVRVLLVAWHAQLEFTPPTHKYLDSFGPIIGIETLATAERRYEGLFGAESESGEAMIRAYIAASGRGLVFTRLQSGTVLFAAKELSLGNEEFASESSRSVPSTSLNRQHRHVALGGTFDHIHIGHKLLLTMALVAVDASGVESRQMRSLTIGITGDQLLKNKKHAELLQSWDDRCRGVVDFIDAVVNFAPSQNHGECRVSERNEPGPNGKSRDIQYGNGLLVKCTEIQDPFGPTITNEEISAMVLSAETRAGGQAVNDKRVEKGWEPLELFEVDVLDAGDDDLADGHAQVKFTNKLSSTAIRERIAQKQQSSL